MSKTKANGITAYTYFSKGFPRQIKLLSKGTLNELQSTQRLHLISQFFLLRVEEGQNARPPSLNLEGGGVRAGCRVAPPSSPTSYDQPPTPEHPPPSPMTAVLGIQEKINPTVRDILVQILIVDFPN